MFKHAAALLSIVTVALAQSSVRSNSIYEPSIAILIHLYLGLGSMRGYQLEYVSFRQPRPSRMLTTYTVSGSHFLCLGLCLYRHEPMYADTLVISVDFK